jgi:hypothetical protein
MKDVKSQFVLGGYGAGNFLLDSLSVAAADTRSGLDAQTATRLAAMQGYVNANPEKTNAERFENYVGKLVGAATETSKPVATLRSKPGTGNGF